MSIVLVTGAAQASAVQLPASWLPLATPSTRVCATFAARTRAAPRPCLIWASNDNLDPHGEFLINKDMESLLTVKTSTLAGA
jgi:hypothetical protein